MTIEPHAVEPGFVKRWTIQSISLMLRSPIIWGVIIATYFVSSKLSFHPIWFFFIGGYLMMISLEFAAFTDFNKMNIPSFFSCIKISFLHYIQFIKDKKNFMIIFCIFFIVLERSVMYAASQLPASDKPPTEPSLFSSMFSAVLFGFIFINSGSHLQLFTYPLKRAFDVSEITAITATCIKASHKNPQVFIFFEFGLFMSVLLLCSIWPIFAIFYAGFIPCIIYVAFREIFWGTRENQKQEEKITEKTPDLALAGKDQ